MKWREIETNSRSLLNYYSLIYILGYNFITQWATLDRLIEVRKQTLTRVSGSITKHWYIYEEWDLHKTIQQWKKRLEDLESSREWPRHHVVMEASKWIEQKSCEISEHNNWSSIRKILAPYAKCLHLHILVHTCSYSFAFLETFNSVSFTYPYHVKAPFLQFVSNDVKGTYSIELARDEPLEKLQLSNVNYCNR